MEKGVGLIVQNARQVSGLQNWNWGGSYLDIFCIILQHLQKFYYFFVFIQIIKFWVTPNFTKCTDLNLLIQRQKAAEIGIWP